MNHNFTARISLTLFLFLSIVSTTQADAPPNQFQHYSKKELRRQQKTERRKLRKIRRRQRRMKRVKRFLDSRRGQRFLSRFFRDLFNCKMIPTSATRDDFWLAAECNFWRFLGTALVFGILAGLSVVTGAMVFGSLSIAVMLLGVVYFLFGFFTFLIGIFL